MAKLVSETTHRTPRKRAKEIGTDARGFAGGVDYDPQAGTPSSSAGHYKDNSEGARSREAGGPPQTISHPFKLGGK